MTPTDVDGPYYFRFSLGQRYLHGLLITTFLGLAGTGLPLRFSDTAWAATAAHAIGGFRTLLFFHKTCAVLLTTGFLIHVVYVLYRVVAKGEAGWFWGPASMVPQLRDFLQLNEHFRWFFWLGPKPKFDRFAYWEKFDYWAVFWGMLIIGVSGYVMWFAPFFAGLLPGSLLNVILLIHGDEALLAVWFIFMIHFFNSHLRPESFPMDPVIFTGRLSGDELRNDHPAEYDRLLKRDGLGAIEADRPPRWLTNFARLIAVGAIGAGFVLLSLTWVAFLARR
ncbi:MAG: cytochrome b/b6 domain-containing protein [Candidatus Binataceae bacterium]